MSEGRWEFKAAGAPYPAKGGVDPFEHGFSWKLPVEIHRTADYHRPEAGDKDEPGLHIGVGNLLSGKGGVDGNRGDEQTEYGPYDWDE